MATIGSLVFKIGADVAELTQGVHQVNAKLDTMPAALQNVQTKAATWGSFMGNVMADVAAKVGQLALDGLKKLFSAMGDLVERSEKMASVGASFDRLATTVGETGEAFLKVSRGAAKGLISDLDLMQAANKGILLGLPITSSSFARLAETAIVLGRAMGQGPNKSLDDLIIGLGRSSPLILDNLGLTVKVGEANDKYAAQLGKSASALTEAEKKAAFYNATMDAARSKVEALGGVQFRSTDILTKMNVGWDNFLDRIAAAINKSPALNQVMSSLANALDKVFAGLEKVIPHIGPGIDKAVIIGLHGFQAFIAGAGMLQGALTSLASSMYDVIGRIAATAAERLAPLAMVFEQLAKLPGPMGTNATLAFTAISGAINVASNTATAFAKTSDAMDRASAATAQTISSLQDRIGGLIGRIRESKVATESKTAAMRESSEVAAVFGKTIEDTGLKIGNGFGLIKQHSVKVDIRGVLDNSIEGFNKLKTATVESVPGFTTVGKAATSLFDDLKKTTSGVMGLSSAFSSFSGSQFGANFGSSMGFGKGMTIAGPAIPNTSSWNAYMKSAGFFHSGGGVGFSGAKRFHSGGLMQGEVPIVAQEGEGILSRRGMAALSRLNGGGSVGGASVNITINAQGAFFDTPDAKERLARMVGDAVVAKMKSQGARV